MVHTIVFAYSSLLIFMSIYVSGWMDVTEHMQSPGSLVLYKFRKAAKPEVVFILVVHPHFTWQLSFHGKLLGPSTSSCLEDVPSVFATASDVVKLLQMLNGCHTCVGNPDMHLSRSVFMNATG